MGTSGGAMVVRWCCGFRQRAMLHSSCLYVFFLVFSVPLLCSVASRSGYVRPAGCTRWLPHRSVECTCQQRCVCQPLLCWLLDGRLQRVHYQFSLLAPSCRCLSVQVFSLLFCSMLKAFTRGRQGLFSSRPSQYGANRGGYPRGAPFFSW